MMCNLDLLFVLAYDDYQEHVGLVRYKVKRIEKPKGIIVEDSLLKVTYPVLSYMGTLQAVAD